MAEVLLRRRLPHELLGDQRMLAVDAGIHSDRQLDIALQVAMAAEIFADHPRAVGHIGEQKQMGTPYIAGRDDELRRTKCHRRARAFSVALYRLRRRYALLAFIEYQAPYER